MHGGAIVAGVQDVETDEVFLRGVSMMATSDMEEQYWLGKHVVHEQALAEDLVGLAAHSLEDALLGVGLGVKGGPARSANIADPAHNVCNKVHATTRTRPRS